MCVVFSYGLTVDHPLAKMFTTDGAFGVSAFLLNAFLQEASKRRAMKLV